MNADEKAQENVPSAEELIHQLKRENPSPRAYVGGFHLTKGKLLEKYEERIGEHAIRLRAELEKQAVTRREAEEAERVRLRKFDEAENARLQDAVARIGKYGQDVDYVDLDNDDRKCFSELSDLIAQKPLDEWKATEKIVFKFWHQLPRSTPQTSNETEKPLTPTETRSLIAEFRELQREQIRAMSAIRWAIVGFSIWFIIQFWLVPYIFSGLLSGR